MREIIEERKKSFVKKYEELCRFRDFTNHLEYYINMGNMFSTEEYEKCKELYEEGDKSNLDILTEVFHLTEEQRKSISNYLLWNF